MKFMPSFRASQADNQDEVETSLIVEPELDNASKDDKVFASANNFDGLQQANESSAAMGDIANKFGGEEARNEELDDDGSEQESPEQIPEFGPAELADSPISVEPAESNGDDSETSGAGSENQDGDDESENRQSTPNALPTAEELESISLELDELDRALEELEVPEAVDQQ